MECFCGHQLIGPLHTVRTVQQVMSYPLESDFPLRERKSQRGSPCRLPPELSLGMQWDLDFSFINMNFPELRRLEAQRLKLLVFRFLVKDISQTFLQHQFSASFHLSAKDGTKSHYHKLVFLLLI